MNTPIQICLIEDNKSFREVINLAMLRDPHFSITSEFGTAEIALRELPKSPRDPDVILLDLNLPGMSGLEAIPLLLTLCTESKILILSQSNEQNDILRAITLGASGYLLKSSGLQDIRNSIQAISNGGAILDPSVAGYLLDAVKESKKEHLPHLLTSRELDILKLLAEGFVKKEISEELKISYSTVDTHVRHIYEKLDARNAPSAISIAHRLGLLS